MKKVLSIVVALALALSCCVVAFASDTNCTAGTFAERVGLEITDEEFARVMTENGIDVTSIPLDAPLTTDDIYSYLEMFLADGTMTPDSAKNITASLMNDYGALDADQVNEIDAKVDEWVAANTTPEDPGEEPGSEDPGGLPFDLSNITDIFSNLGGNIDLSQFLEGAKSGIGQLFDGLKGAGLPDISGLTGLLGSIPGLDMIMGLFGGGGDDGGNGGSGTTPSPYTPSTNPSGGNSNSQVIPKTADTAPIAAVATLAVVAGVAFVLTRKKNED